MAAFEAPPVSLRYVLVYSTESAPDDFSLMPYSVEEMLTTPSQQGNEEQLARPCCETRGTWYDPHLLHIISMFCPRCKSETGDMILTAGEFTVDLQSDNKNHMVVKCPASRSCRNSTTKVRILRRGRGPLSSGNKSPILDVEVIGPLRVFVGKPVGDHKFELYAVHDHDPNQKFRTNYYREKVNGRWDLEVEGIARGFVRGFGAHWEEAAWDDSEYDRYRLRVVDDYNAVRQGWPPQGWTSDGSEEDEVQVSNEGGDQEEFGGHEGDEGNGGEHGYVASDAESGS